MHLLYGGEQVGGVGVGDMWMSEKPKAGSPYIGTKKLPLGVFNKVQKVSQCTCQGEMVIDSSLISNMSLLVSPSSTVYPIIDCHGYTRS